MSAERVEFRPQCERVIGMRRRRVHIPEYPGRAFVNAQSLLNEFDLIAEAPSGVAKLRQLILQLAVRGRLVPQDSKDGVAGTGLKELRFPEKEPYSIPENWRWTTLRSVSKELGQKVPDAPFTYIDVSAIDSERGMVGEQVQILGPSNAPSRARKLVDVGTVIYSTVRPYLLNIAVVDREFDPAPIVSTAFFVMCPVKCVASRFLFHYLRSDSFTAYVQGAMTGMAYPAINDAKMTVAPFPLPPLAEQKRIVALVDELMKRCDDLEERQKDRNECRTALTASCLHAVTKISPKSAASEIRRVLDSFPLLIDTPESVAELRKAILQLAVKGRLGTQDPETWRTLQLEDMGNWAIGSGFPTHYQGVTNGEIPFCKVSDMNLPGNEMRIELTVNTVDAETVRRIGARVHPMGTVVFPKIGGAIATNKRRILTKPTAIDNNCLGLTPKRDCTTEWLYLVLSSIDFAAYQSGTSVPALAQGNIGKIKVRLPSLAEQKRVVSVVDDLLALCNELENMLTKSFDDADILVATLVHRLCNSGKVAPEAAT